MQVVVHPSTLSGSIKANPSKSHAQRAIALAALARGTSAIYGIGDDHDTQSALRIASAMGAIIRQDSPRCVLIEGGNPLIDAEWNCGESGLGMRMFSAIAGLFTVDITITGEGSLMRRPAGQLAGPLQALGVRYSDHEGFLPITIRGPYMKEEVQLDGSIGSQFLTGLLIALAIKGSSYRIEVTNLKSRPFIDLTLSTLAEFGIEVSHERHALFEMEGPQTLHPAKINIQGDWSGMAFILVGAAITGAVRVAGLSDPGVQPDGRIVEALTRSGASVLISDTHTSVKKNFNKSFEFDCTHCPDLFPPLAALAVHCSGESRIHGLHRLKLKESDRSFALQNEFQKLGISIREENDCLIIEKSAVRGGIVEAHGDHRIAMALSIVALNADGPVTINGAECVSKSYPAFFRDLKALNVECSTLNVEC